jgi:hypothetical protein
MARQPAKRPRDVPGPPTMPGRFAWVQYDFTPETVAELLGKARVPGGPDYANLEAAAWGLNDLVYAIGEPAPPRPESIAAWCEETATAADVLLRRFGADPAWIARGSAVLPAEARANLREIFEPALMLAPPESPLATLAHELGFAESFERPSAIAPALAHLGLMYLALNEAGHFWRKHSAGGGRNAAHRARLLAVYGAKAYRHATGREPGLKEQSPALRFLEILATRLGVATSPQAMIGHMRRGVAKTSAKKGEK